MYQLLRWQDCSLSSSIRTVSLPALLAGLLLASLLGCDRPPQTASTNEPAAEPTNSSIVPLRVWIVGPIADEQIWMRHWLAGSEQSLEFRSLKIEELLTLQLCDCDVLLYPARLIGELAERGWIVKLPEGVDSTVNGDGGDSPTARAPMAWRQQASYAGQTMAIPLGCSLPVFLGSSAFPVVDHMLDWSELLKQLQLAEIDTPKFTIAEQQVDREALVDRFLAIVATLSARDPSYGLLFDLQSMHSRLTDESFVRSAKILAALASQPDGLVSVVDSHSIAWSWIGNNSRAAVAIATPALLDMQATIVANGQIIRVGSVNQGLADNSAIGSTSSERPRVMAWNSGAGLLASLSGQCRQSNQAISLLHWLSQPSTRSVLTKFTSGIESPTPVASAESLVWKASQSLSEVVTSSNVALEPRLPLATEYRRALADALIEFLSGKTNASQAMQAADKSWQAITDQAGPAQRTNYEKSLGLTL